MNAERVRKYMIGVIYEQNKIKNSEMRNSKTDINSDKIKKYSGHITAVAVGEKFHISPGTVQKYYNFYRVVEKIRKKSNNAAYVIFSDDYRFSYNQILQLSNMHSEEIPDFVEACRKKHTKKSVADVGDFVRIIKLWIYFMEEYKDCVKWELVSSCERQEICCELRNLMRKSRNLIAAVRQKYNEGEEK